MIQKPISNLEDSLNENNGVRYTIRNKFVHYANGNKGGRENAVKISRGFVIICIRWHRLQLSCPVRQFRLERRQLRV